MKNYDSSMASYSNVSEASQTSPLRSGCEDRFLRKKVKRRQAGSAANTAFFTNRLIYSII